MGESSAGDPDLQPPEGQAGPGEEGTQPPETPVEDGQGEAGQGESVAEPEWSADRKKGYTEGTQKYAEDLRERDLTIERLQVEQEVERRRTAAPQEERFPDGVDQGLFTQAQRASPEFRGLMQKLSSLEATVSGTVIDTELARLEHDYGKQPYSKDVAEKVRAALRGSTDLKGPTVEAAYHHFSAPNLHEALVKAQSELRALKKGQKDAISKDGFSAPGAHAAGGSPPVDVRDMSDEQLANAYMQSFIDQAGG